MFSRDSVPDEQAFVSAVTVVKSILVSVKPRDNEELFLIEYFKEQLKEKKTNDDRRIYIYLMLLHFFKERALPIIDASKIQAKAKWIRFLTHHGFNKLVKQHFEFNKTPITLVNEAFLLWIIQ